MKAWKDKLQLVPKLAKALEVRDGKNDTKKTYITGILVRYQNEV